MITVLTVVCLILTICAIVGLVFACRYADDGVVAFSAICTFVLICATIGLFITDMVFIGKISTANVYDMQIEVVEEENSELEEQICSAVENYLKHEGDIFQSLDITTAIGLYSAYPNLKSNELVQSLIETYQANTSEIKALKMKKTEISKYKWLVYFRH